MSRHSADSDKRATWGVIHWTPAFKVPKETSNYTQPFHKFFLEISGKNFNSKQKFISSSLLQIKKVEFPSNEFRKDFLEYSLKIWGLLSEWNGIPLMDIKNALKFELKDNSQLLRIFSITLGFLHTENYLV